MKIINRKEFQDQYDTIVNELIKTNDPITLIDDDGAYFVYLRAEVWKAMKDGSEIPKPEDIKGKTFTLVTLNDWNRVSVGLSVQDEIEISSESIKLDKPIIPFEVVEVVEILPTRVWIESDFFGSKHVMIQHEGEDPHCWCSFYYDYRYTSNSSIRREAELMAVRLGATEPVEERVREFKGFNKES